MPIKPVFKKSAFVLVSTLLPKISIIIFGFILIKYLGIEKFGEYTLAFTTGILLIQFIPDAITSFYASKTLKSQSTEDGCKIISYAVFYLILFLVPLILLISLLIFSITPYFYNQELRNSSLIFLLISPLFAIIQIINSQLNLRGYEKKVLLVSIFASLNQVAFGLIGALNYEVTGVAIGIFFSNLITFLVTLIVARNIFNLNFFGNIDKSINLSKLVIGAREIFPLMLGFALGLPVHWLVMRMLASHDDGMFEVGIFSYSYFYYTLIILIPSSLQSYVIGLIANEKARANGFQRYLNKNKLLWFLIIIFIGMTIPIYIYITPIVTGYEISNKVIFLGVSAIASGSIALIAILLSQYIIGLGGYKAQLHGAILVSFLYLTVSYLMIKQLDLGAISIFIALTLAQLFQITFFYILIKYKKHLS